MSTQIQVSPKSGLTIGTTAITSGVSGRVLFEGIGNVVQEDAGFLFDSVNKSLTNYGKGGITSNTSFGLNASQSNTTGANNVSIGFESLKNNLTGGFTTAIGYTALRDMTGIGYSTAIGWGAGIGITSGHTNTLLGYSAGNGITTGNNNTIIGVNIATLAAGTLNNVILADGGGNIAIKKDANHFVGIGYSATATLGAKLDIKAQGALSTDIALRVVESTNIRSPFAVLGNEITQISADGVGFAGSALPLNIKSGTSSFQSWLGLDIEHTVRTGYMAIQSQGIQSDYNNVRFISGSSKGNGRISAYITQSDTDKVGHWQFRTQVHLGDAFRLRNPNYGTHSLVIETGISPTTTPLDGFVQYSADIVAGNAAPHFRTENGSVIKLYKQNLATNPTNAELATFLSNLGLANLI